MQACLLTHTGCTNSTGACAVQHSVKGNTQKGLHALKIVMWINDCKISPPTGHLPHVQAGLRCTDARE